MNKFLIKLFCRFIPNRTVRNRVRFLLDNRVYVRKSVKFVKSFGDFKNIKKIVGRGSRNLVLVADNKYVFKFPGHGDGYEKALREKKITDVLRPISPIKIPDMEILDFDGIAVRKYPYVNGVNLECFAPSNIPHDIEVKIAKQLAKFLYVIGQSDPKELRGFKSHPNEKPSMAYGWCQNDIKYNFIMNPKTYDIIAMIDWEEVGFNDFCKLFTYERDYRSLMTVVLQEYLKLCGK
ncbi:MAG: hypothetical protein J5608_01875 [Alphaproteobacteria bacterium]|nr:hypothetical protein [Alphaproteobacteria bacterium]